HVFSTGGFFTIAITLVDNSNGTDSKTSTVMIAGVGVQDGVLMVIGTNAADHVSVNLSGQPTARYFNVHLGSGDRGSDGGTDSGTDVAIDANQVREMQITTCAGDDHVQIASHI